MRYFAVVLLFVFAFARPAGAEDNAVFLSALREVLQDDHADLRDASWILETSGLGVDEIVAQLANALGDARRLVVLEAAGILGDLGPRAGAAKPALSRLLTRASDGDTRCAAAVALSRIGPEANGTPYAPKDCRF